MIKTLRRKIVAIAMLSTTVVLFCLIGFINIINYQNVLKQADRKIELISLDHDFQKEDLFPDNNKPPREQLPVETPFDMRYFTVSLNDDDSILEVNTSHIYAITEDEAQILALELATNQKESGFWGQYRYQMLNGMYIFLDCERELLSFKNFLFVSISVSLVGLFFVYLFMLFFSSRLIRPIAESYEKQKRFITDASHELKTPLTIIDANTEVLEMTSGENEWTKSIRKQIRRLSSLTEKLVFLSRMDEENTVFEMYEFSLSDMILDMSEPFEQVAITKGKSLILQVEPSISYVGNEDALRQVVSILLDNALKYSKEKSAISISLKRGKRGILFQVLNEVESFPIAKHEELFERFYRADTSRNSETGGHGIGLSLAKSIIHAHKSKISAVSTDGTSLLFTITFL